jgi:hypothetical protein
MKDLVTDMGRIGKNLEESCCGLEEEKRRRLADDMKEGQNRILPYQVTERELPEFKLEAFLLDPTCSVSLLFGDGGGKDDDGKANLSVSCRRYHSFIFCHFSLPEQMSYPFSTIV